MEVCCEPAISVKAKRVQEELPTTLHLTRLDQIRNYYYPSLLFYPPGQLSCTDQEEHGDHNACTGAVLHGLQAMVEYYPWAAGRLHVAKHLRSSPDSAAEEEEQEYLEVCINDDGGPGAQFVAARVNCPLHSLGDLSDPNPAFEPLFAKVDESAPYHSRPLVALQVSIFQCGGLCISMTSNHVLFDGFAASIFLQNMGSCARNRGLCLPLDLAPRVTRIYPHSPPAPLFPCSMNYTHKENFQHLTTKQVLLAKQLVATKFVYTEQDIAKLRTHALSNQEDCKKGFRACSRLQVIIAHLWRAKARCMLALHEDPLQEFPCCVGVNVRKRVIASIPTNYVGCAVGVVTPSTSLKELSEKSLAFVVEIVQEAIKQMTPERFQSDIDHLEILGCNARVNLPSLAIPSLANLGFYDIDFGWGKPTHFARHYKQSCNFVNIIDGDAQCTSYNVFIALMSEHEQLIFQNAIEWELSH